MTTNVKKTMRVIRMGGVSIVECSCGWLSDGAFFKAEIEDQVRAHRKACHG